MQELIPYVEEQFRIIQEPYARILSGGSTGGWISLALQIFEEIEDHRNRAVAIRNLAIIEYNLSNYDEALRMLDKGIDLYSPFSYLNKKIFVT